MSSDTGGTSSEGDARYQAGAQAEGRKQVQEAFFAYGQALAAYRAAGDRVGAAVALRALGSLSTDQKLFGDARRYLDEALARALGDRRAEALTLGLLSNVSFGEGRFDQMGRELEESLRIGEEIGDDDIVGAARQNLGALRRSQRMWIWRLLRLG